MTQDPQFCIKYVKRQGNYEHYREYGIPPIEVNKGGRPPSLKSKFTAQELLGLDETDAMQSLAPNLAMTYFKLKRECNRSRTPRDPKEQTVFKYPLYAWQRLLLDELLEQPAPERLVVWYRDSKGNAGKSYLARYLFENYPSRCLLLDISRKADMCYLVRP